MDDGCDSGYPSPRDEVPSTSTPSSGKKPSLKKHFPKLDEIQYESDSHGKTRIPRSKPSKTAVDGGIRLCMDLERKREEELEERIRQEYQKRVEDLEFERNEAKDAVEIAQTTIKEKGEEINQLNKQVAELQKSLDDGKTHSDLNKKLRARCKSLQSENNDMRTLIEAYEREKEELKTITNQQEENSKSLFEETERLCEETASLQEQLAKMQRESEALLEKCTVMESEKKDLQEKLEAAQQENGSIPENYTILQKAHNELKQDLKQKIEAHAVDRNHMEQLQTEVETLKKELGGLGSETAEKKILKEEVSEYQAIVAKLETTIHQLEDDKIKLKEEATRFLDESNTFQGQIESKQKEIDFLGRNYSELEELYNKMESDFKRKAALDRDHIEQLQNERDLLQQEVLALEEKLAALSRTANGLRTELTECRKRNDEMILKNDEQYDNIKSLQTELEELKQANATLTHKCETAEGDKKRYVARLNDLNAERKEKENLQGQLEECQAKITTLEEKLPRLESENAQVKIEMEDVKRKNGELESINEHYARNEVETSTKIQNLERHLSGKQRECQQLSEKLTILSRQLEEADSRAKQLSAALAKDSQAQKNYVDLERLNLQLTNEIEYLRVKTREQPSQEAYRQVSEILEQVKAELRGKVQQLEEIQQRCGELDYKLKNVQPDLDRRTRSVKLLEEEVDSLKRDNKTLRGELIEKCDANTKLIEEFERFKGTMEAEIGQYALRLTEAEANYARTHAQLQREMHLRALSSGDCISSLWDGIPDDIRQQLPQESETTLKSIKIGRGCTPSPSSYSDNGRTDEFSSKLAELLELYSLEKLSASGATCIIFNITSRLLREYKDNLDSFVEPFASELSQLIEQRDNKYLTRISEVEQMKEEESRGKREYYMKAQNLEDDLYSANNFVRSLQSQLTVLKAEFDAKLKIIETRDYTIAQLNEEVEALKEIRAELQEQAGEYEKAANEFMEMIKEYEAEANQHHEEICSIERESEVLKSEKTELEREFDHLQRENEDIRKKLKELEQIAYAATGELEECKKRLIKEEKSKRFNQDTMRKCFELVDQHKEMIVHLKHRNWQRQQVLDKILRDINAVCSQKTLEGCRKLLNETCPRWKKDDEEINRRGDEVDATFSKMIRERETPILTAAFMEARKQRRS